MSALRTTATANVVAEDFETRGSTTDHQDLRLWLRMMAVHKLITNEISAPIAGIIWNELGQV